MDNQSNTFLAATKCKLRFALRGQLSTEDLWDLSLKDLDTLAVAADAAVTQSGGKTFLANPDRRITADRAEQTLRLEVLKAVIETKQAENADKVAKTALRARREFLEGLLQKKQIDQLEGLSVEEIQAQLAALNA